MGRQRPDRSCQDASVWTGEEPDSDSLLLSCSDAVNSKRTVFLWFFFWSPFFVLHRKVSLHALLH